MGKIKIHWGRISIVSVIAFIVGWLIFGFLGAVILAMVAMVLMGIIDVS